MIFNFNKSHIKRGFLQISFAWLFALVVGAFILLLAIFVSIKMINTEQTTEDAATAKDIGVLLNPLETGFENGKKTLLDLPSETRIYSYCEEGDFGNQKLKVSQKSLGKWTDTGVEISIQNRYVFSESPSEGRQFYILSLPFEFPFKVADLIILIPKNKNYCFVNPSEDFFKIFSDLKLENVFNASSIGSCPENSEKFCFNSQCTNGTIIHESSKYIEKEKNLHYET
ncbi:MAG: hypothetical protein AABW50_00780, partial [Nanoarchaeota archaeon]